MNFECCNMKIGHKRVAVLYQILYTQALFKLYFFFVFFFKISNDLAVNHEIFVNVLQTADKSQ